MAHFVCTGSCRGVNDQSGVCHDEECPNYGQPLSECSCEDGLHGGVLEPKDYPQNTPDAE